MRLSLRGQPAADADLQNELEACTLALQQSLLVPQRLEGYECDNGRMSTNESSPRFERRVFFAPYARRHPKIEWHELRQK